MEDINNIEQKQQFLRDEILDKSYDVEEFSDFMSKFKDNGTDLKNWEFIELKEAVKIFKNRVKEDENQKIEKGVEKIRQSYRFDDIQNQNDNFDEYLDIDLQFINKNENNNNCVNNILNEYIKNENEKNKINKIKEEENKKINNIEKTNIDSNNANNLNENISNNNFNENNNKNKIRIENN